jgi:hypothetical protein
MLLPQAMPAGAVAYAAFVKKDSREERGTRILRPILIACSLPQRISSYALPRPMRKISATSSTRNVNGRSFRL